MVKDLFHGLLDFRNCCFGVGCMCPDVGAARGLDKAAVMAGTRTSSRQVGLSRAMVFGV